jgi:integrase
MKHNITPDVTIGVDKGNLRLRITGRLWENNKPRFIALKIHDSPQNRLAATQKQLQLQQAINDGSFDPTLGSYVDWGKPTTAKYCSNLEQVSLFALWDMWCEYRQPLVAVSTYKQKFRGSFLNSLRAIGCLPITPATATYTRQWLIDNRNKSDNVWLLSELEKGCERLINDRILIGGNPFLGMSKALNTARNKVLDNRTVDQIVGDLSRRSHYLPSERDAILSKFAEAYPHYWLFTYFRFFTGCRYEESTGIQWGDITSDCKVIVFRRTYSDVAKETKVTKTGKMRRFNCNDQLTQLLLAHRFATYHGDDSAIVFTNRGNTGNGKYKSAPTYITLAYYKRLWNRITTDLLAQGIIEVALSPKYTRHTLSNLASQAGIDPAILAKQMGHSESVMNAFYRDKSVGSDACIN